MSTDVKVGWDVVLEVLGDDGVELWGWKERGEGGLRFGDDCCCGAFV